VATVAALTASPGVAAASYPPPDGPLNTIERVYVPVDNPTAEAAQMAIAMAFGAAIATAIRGGRGRREPAAASTPTATPIDTAGFDLVTTVGPATQIDILSSPDSVRRRRWRGVHSHE
jgi:hypothetical protein